MLKSNSKKARENIRAYIIDHFTPENYTETPPTDPREIFKFIFNCFTSEKYSTKEDYAYYRNNEQAAFRDWCAGLPSVLDTCYYYNRSAADDVAAILEETEAERAQFSESMAEDLLTSLIYRTIKEGCTV